jgi:hypothetical protein
MNLVIYYQYLMNVSKCNVGAESVWHVSTGMTDNADEKSAG